MAGLQATIYGFVAVGDRSIQAILPKNGAYKIDVVAEDLRTGEAYKQLLLAENVVQQYPRAQAYMVLTRPDNGPGDLTRVFVAKNKQLIEISPRVIPIMSTTMDALDYKISNDFSLVREILIGATTLLSSELVSKVVLNMLSVSSNSPTALVAKFTITKLIGALVNYLASAGAAGIIPSGSGAKTVWLLSIITLGKQFVRNLTNLSGASLIATIQSNIGKGKSQLLALFQSAKRDELAPMATPAVDTTTPVEPIPDPVMVKAAVPVTAPPRLGLAFRGIRSGLPSLIRKRPAQAKTSMMDQSMTDLTPVDSPPDYSTIVDGDLLIKDLEMDQTP